MSENRLEIHDRELQRQLTLTTADLRFGDILVKAVTGVGDNGYFDGTGNCCRLPHPPLGFFFLFYLWQGVGDSIGLQT